MKCDGSIFRKCIAIRAPDVFPQGDLYEESAQQDFLLRFWKAVLREQIAAAQPIRPGNMERTR